MDNKEEFETWWRNNDWQIGQNVYHAAGVAWKHQQSKIDQLEKDKQELIDNLLEIIRVDFYDYGEEGLFYWTIKIQFLEKLTGKSIEELLK